MKHKKLSISMRTKILVFFTASTLFALILQAVLFQKTSSVLIYNQGKEASLNSLQNMQDDIYTFIKSIENSIIEVYNQKEFIGDLAGGMENSTLKIKYSRVAYDMALSVFESSQNINALYIYDMKDNLISSYRHATTPMYTYPDNIYINGKNNNADIVRQYAKSDNKVMLVSSYYNNNRKKNIIRFVLKIYANNSDRRIGYIVCDTDEKNFLKRVEKYAYSDEQIVWLQPKGDRPVIQIGNLTGTKKDYYLKAVSLISTNTGPLENSVNTKGSVSFEILQKKYNLAAFSLTPQILLEQSQRVLTRNLMVIAILIIIVFVIVSIVISQSLTTPLKHMVDTIVNIKNGDTLLRVSNLKNDEIGKLGEEFNEMLDQIQNLIMKEYQDKLLLDHAEYKALQAQVNPHFLYNTLETMSSIAASQQCNTVSSLCKALSNIFRYSIDMKDSLSTIEREIIHIKNYMYVMNVRLQNSIDFDVNIDNSLLSESVPIISIQPLVENSILHGLKDKRGDKKIKIEVKGSEESIEISVIDNGIGMDAEVINSQIKISEFEVLEKSASIGLCNINARVKLLFGENYGVIVNSIVGEGSKVSLCVPRMKKGGA
jgi:sensor histidine kinase YesM